MVKLFGILENFFYVSLGITFALILLLVYHFKQRLSAAEKKSDTMYEIITNVVQELNVMKSQLRMNQLQMQVAQPKPEPIPITPIQYNEADSEADDEADDEGDYYTESDSDSDSEEDDDEYDDVSIIKYELIEVRDPTDAHEEVVLEAPELDTPYHEEVVLEAPELDTPYHEEVVLEAPELDTQDHEEVVLEAPELDTPYHEEVVLEAPELDSHHEEAMLVEDIKPELDELKDVSIIGQDYKKMNLNQLRSLATAKFPEIDTGKMKKAEIIKVLTDTIAQGF